MPPVSRGRGRRAVSEGKLHRIEVRPWNRWWPWMAWLASGQEYIPDQAHGPHQSAYWETLVTAHGSTRERAVRRANRRLSSYLLRRQRDADMIIQLPFEGA